MMQITYNSDKEQLRTQLYSLYCQFDNDQKVFCLIQFNLKISWKHCVLWSVCDRWVKKEKRCRGRKRFYTAHLVRLEQYCLFIMFDTSLYPNNTLGTTCRIHLWRIYWSKWPTWERHGWFISKSFIATNFISFL